MAAAAGASDDQQYADEREVVEHFQRLQDEVHQLYLKVAELEQELREHDLVLKALSSVEDSRKCYRMVGDVLVERTVGTVAPAVQLNRTGIQDVIEKLKQSATAKEAELRDLQRRYNIRFTKPGARSAAGAGAAKGSSGQGQGADSLGVLA